MRKNLKPSQNRVEIAERAATVLGVPGRYTNAIYDAANGLFVNQRFIASRPYKESGYKKGSTITVEIRFDDECRNGQQSFAITGHVQEPGARDWDKCGCIHDDIEKYFPEFAHLIAFHLYDTRGPMHYPSNALYFASNRDHWGLLKGEASTDAKHQETRIRFGDSPISHKISERFRAFIWDKMNTNNLFLVNPVEHEKKPGETYDFKPKYSFLGYECAWYQCPFDTLAEAEEWAQALTSCKVEFISVPTLFGTGKERELDKARSVANWPDATDEQLSAPRTELEAALLARLPGLVAEFRAAMDAIGMQWRERITEESASNE